MIFPAARENGWRMPRRIMERAAERAGNALADPRAGARDERLLTFERLVVHVVAPRRCLRPHFDTRAREAGSPDGLGESPVPPGASQRAKGGLRWHPKRWFISPIRSSTSRRS